LNAFPQYGVGLTKFEDNETVKNALSRINEKPLAQIQEDIKIGMPMNDTPLPKGPLAPEIIAGGEWFNSKPLTLNGLKGKVVIVDFWTYSCINCQRTLPYLRKWWSTYKDKGLVIVGVHTPEFEFEKNPKNLAQAIKDFNLQYPIVQDNDYGTWQAYENSYWPAKYFIDKDGYIRYTHFGEGAYDESEKVIQKLLAETGATDVSQPIHNQEYEVYSETPETYLGYARINNFSSNEQISNDELDVYSASGDLYDNQFSYVGNWLVMSEYAQPQKGAELNFNFSSKEVYLVMRPKDANKPAKVKVYLDGKQQFFGKDNVAGVVSVEADRLYRLITLPEPGRHMLKLEFEDTICRDSFLLVTRV
jgi:thiol-disulfide isomerase/thioredoxin